ncbi:MAG TPA: Npt1/Npt2 family nucleotide transporter [Vicinamibacteria bacterium]|nr:Npt1/Npt2 family nucleotide transporter [Vicinamibacteria bacterium]
MPLLRLVNVHPGEGRRVFGMFALLGLIIATSYILKPVRSSVFLSQFGAERLPYVYLMVALVLGLVATGFARLSSRTNVTRLFVVAALLFASHIVLFWIALIMDWVWTGFVFYVWVSIFTALMPSLFWLLANYVFYSNEGRRLFPVVMAGGLLGSIAGGALTSLLVPVVGTSGLLLSAGGLLVLIAFLVRWNVAREAERITERRYDLARSERSRAVSDEPTPLALIVRSRYLRLLAALILLAALVSTLVDYQFNVSAEQSFPTRDALTRFFGTFFASINVVAFALQLLVAGRLLGRFGVAAGLVLLPAALFGSSLFVLAMPSLASAALVKACDDGLSNSVNRASVEILYLPVSLALKNRLKAWLDMFVERVSRGLGGLTLLAATSLLSMSASQIGLLVGFLTIPWLVLVVWLNREYVNTFRDSIARRDITDFTSSLTDPASLSVFRQVLAGNDTREILYALELLAGTEDELLLRQAASLTDHPNAEIRRAAFRLLRGAAASPIDQLERRVLDEEPRVAAEAFALYLRVDPDAASRTLDFVIELNDIQRIQAVLDCLEQSETTLSVLVLERIVRDHVYEEKAGARMLAAQALGFLTTPPDALPSWLVSLLGDQDIEVARRAARSAGRLRVIDAFPALVEQLRRPPLRVEARRALARYGPEALDRLSQLLRDDTQEIDLRRALPQAIAEIDQQGGVEVLFDILPQDDQRLHYQAIKGLSKLRSRNPMLRFPRTEVERLVEHERAALLDLARLTASIRRDAPEAQTSHSLLLLVLDERIEFTRERIFRLLGLQYSQDEIASVFNRLAHARPAIRSAALEYLANLLSKSHRRSLLPLLEAQSSFSIYQRGLELTGVRAPAFSEALERLALSTDDWLAACAITVAGDKGLAASLPGLEELRAHESLRVREAVEHAVRPGGGSRDSGRP